ncbi:amino acid ABC transporter permease [Caproicibacter fermentans]|uniref:Amino acid ABC transporter permease n=2 Tax=Caproicibacter fermentans TaxID=2576756 RepID=A0A7G8TFR3_9FIRM|nr:amino acid ABC transporter permease [Caproicibacter fermentans]
MTLKVTTFGILIGILLGLFFALMRISKYRALTIPAKAYIWVIRGTPLLLQLLLIYYGLVGVVKMDNLPAAFVALGVHNGAYIAEIFRGAIQSVDRGQTEAGVSLGMTRRKVMRRIIFPQAFKRALPSLSNQFIIALKDSSLASSIAVPELLLKAKQIGSANFKLMESLSVAAVFYLVMTSVLTIITGLIEHALKTSSRQA